MSTKHTPGPWLTDGRTVYALQQDGWRKGELVMVNRFSAYVQSGHGPDGITPFEEIEANARLIAAAPDMLSALMAAGTVLEAHGLETAAVVRAAIAKATAAQ